MSPQLLPAAWHEWLALNLERGCSDADLLRDMRTGGIAASAARAALNAMRSDLTEKNSNVLPYIDTAAHPAIFEILHPRIVLIDHFLNDRECEGLIEFAETGKHASAVVDPQSGVAVTHPARTGSISFMQHQNPLIDEIESRLSNLLHWPLERFEHLQVIGYESGNEYRAHHDCFDENDGGASVHLARGGQRVGTLLIYLQEPENGGATSFPQVGMLKIHPRRGAALWFQNVTMEGRMDPRLLHAGEPVIGGRKYICSAWLRQETWRTNQRSEISE
jgi:prolyl 4-hydroxylase